MKRRPPPPAPPAYYLATPTPAGLERVPLNLLRLAQRPVKRQSERQLSMLMSSMRVFGFVTPVLIDADNEVICGHGRVEAARRLGLTDVPVVRITHLSRAQIQAYRVADNKLAELSAWNEDVVRDILAELPAFDIDPEALGFEIAEVDKLLVYPGTQAESEEDVTPVCRSVLGPGDCFAAGDHRVICGDVCVAAICAKLMNGDVAQLCITDPPFNVPIVGHVMGRGKRKHRDFAMASGEMSNPQFQAFLATSLGLAKHQLAPGSLVYVAMDGRGIGRLYNAAELIGLEYISLCVWAKDNAGMGSFYRSQVEFFAVFRVPGARHRNNIQLGRHGRSRSTLWSYPGANSFGPTRDEDLAMHPTVKPAQLIEDAIKDSTKRGDLIFDGFGGSGTTMIAAERCKRRARLVEIDPGYVETSLDRYHRTFGVEAVHTDTGLTLSQLREARRSSAGQTLLPFYPEGDQ